MTSPSDTQRPKDALSTPMPSKERVHDLKCWPPYFAAVADGSKPFEVRLNDRDYHVDDILRLREWDYDTEVYTGREVRKRVTYMTAWAQQENHVVMGLADVSPTHEPCPGEHEDPDFKREDGSCTICSPQPPVLEWQPIDTAPKDGTSILGYVLPPRMQASLEGPRVVKWAGEFGMWSMPGISGLTCSHWMPVPSGPTKAGE